MTRFIAALVASLAVLGWVYVAGYASGKSSEQGKAKDAEIKQLREAFAQGQAVGQVRDVVVTEYVDRERVIYKTGKTITKEVPVYVTPAADAACTLTRGFVRLHDAAAANVLPGPAEPADAGPAGIALSTATEVVSDNYTACHANRNQLVKLQKWLREAKQATLEASAHE
ncbi:hypothetical protein QSV36_03510 [Pseudomonas sp. BCRC 81390]|uniref:hypothetical protein n=1 Tax=Pseudomonas sp. BCRC 81390 TaxID=3054778 RepID=UPI002599E86A|nr:hypothetical protein [Pseudomonas sp. BCRC 81390]MDM3884665.1 hypothetical protein [Pseudomonas sp. BCRC 81390]